MPTNESASEDQLEAIDLRMLAWLVSALIHVLVVLALPLLDLPPFAHDRPTQLEIESVAPVVAEFGETPITQVVLSMTLPDAHTATLAERFAAKLPSPTTGPGQAAALVDEMETSVTTVEPVCELRGNWKIDLGPNEFDPAGTRDIIAARTDLSLLVPDERVTQTPLLAAEDLTGSLASGSENEALAAALRWIVSKQGVSRRRRIGYVGDTGTLHVENTSLALLPLLAMGQTHRSGKYQPQIQGAVDYLLASADEDVDRRAEAMRAVAFCELFLATRDPKLRKAAEIAVQQVIRTNYTPYGGFSYSVYSGPGRPRRHTPSAYEWAWQVWAVYAGQLAGLQDNTNVLPTLHGHCHLGAEDPLVASSYSLYDLRDTLLVAAADRVAAAGPAKEGERRRETDYYTTLLLARMQHPKAQQFQQELTDHLLSRQLKAGPDIGGWQPEHDADTPLTATIFSALILTAPSQTTAIHKPRTTVP